MVDSDVGTFDRAFRRLSGAFRLKLKPGEFEELSKTYFKLMDAYPIEAVLKAGKTCLTTQRTFPKPADWLAELSTSHGLPAPGIDRRWMTETEMDELARAIALHYEDLPCGCVACLEAGVSHRSLRYVPTMVLDDVVERAYHSHHARVEVIGHWAHGEELARWYAARDAFYALAVRHRVPRVLQLVGVREPGQEG